MWKKNYDDDDVVIPSLRKLTSTRPHPKKPCMCAADSVMAVSQFVTLKPAAEPSRDSSSTDRFYQTGSLTALSTAALACLPKSCPLWYCAQHFEEAWSHLREKFKNAPEIADCRRCFMHITGVTE